MHEQLPSSPTRLPAALLAAGLFLTGCTSEPKDTTSTSFQPDAARLAIASGLQCDIAAIDDLPAPIWSTAAERNESGVNITYTFEQTPDAVAARKQYDGDDAVRWRSFLGADIYLKGDGELADKIDKARTNVVRFDAKRDYSRSFPTLLPTGRLEEGSRFNVYAAVQVETGSKDAPTTSLGKASCGVVELNTQGQLHEVDVQQPPSETITTNDPTDERLL